MLNHSLRMALGQVIESADARADWYDEEAREMEHAGEPSEAQEMTKTAEFIRQCIKEVEEAFNLNIRSGSK